MKTKMETIKNILTANQIRPTYIRLKILEYLYSCKEHPSADSIYAVLEKEIPTISRTSVYNTLSLLEEKGLVTAHYFSGSSGRYDCHGGMHYHFVCDECKKILDVDVTCKILEECDIQGHIVRESFGYFKGLCQACQGKKTAETVSVDSPDLIGDQNINKKEIKNV